MRENRKNTADDMKKQIDWPKIKEKLLVQYSNKPAVFIGSAVATVFLFFLILLPSSENPVSPEFNDNPISLSIPSPEDKHPTEPDDEIDLTQTIIFDAPPIEEEFLDSSATDIASDQLIEISQTPEFSPPQPIMEKTTIAPPKKSKEKSWVFKKNPEHYTVQLISSGSKTDVVQFIDANKQLKRLSYFHTIRNGKSWYVVVQSTYDSYSEANKMRKRLPEHIAKNSPWVRQYGSIQQELVVNANKINLLNSAFASSD